MRRHLDDHPSLNSSRVYGNTSLPLTSGTASNSPARAVSDIDARAGNANAIIPVATSGATSSLSSNLPLHHQGRPSNTPLSPGVSSGANKPSIQRQPLALIQETVHSVGSSSSAEMQSTVQFSHPSGNLFQSRVAVATTLSQGSLGHNPNPSAAPHSHSVQSQSHSSQIVHPAQANSQTHAAQMQGHQMQFQRLKVEDALSYLDQVKYKFGNQPQVYNDFLDIMKEFKSQSIDTPGVIQRVSNLFRGHSELIVGFNTFLPPGYRIEVQSNEQVQVSIPGTNMGPGTPGTAPTSLTIHPGGITTTTTINQNIHTSQSNQSNHASHPTSANPASSNAASKSSNHQSPVSNSQPHTSTPNTTHAYNQNSPAHTQSSGASPGVHSPNSGSQTSQPVEFNHAINYVNKIKNRFQGQPEIYKHFLEILHTYQKEQRNLKDGIQTGQKTLTESEVYTQVAQLFQNQEDLLQEFGQFLPDANGAASALVILQTPKVANSEHTVTVKKPVLPAKPLPPPTSNTTKQVQAIKRPAPSAPSTPVKKVKMTSLKDVTLAEAGKYGSLTEFAFFDKVRKSLKSQDVYENFLRCLVIYNQEIISRADLVQLIAPFLSKYPELFKWFKDFLGYKETNNNIEAVPNKIATQERERVIGDFATEIDYSSCKKYGASYRAVPRNYVQPKCSGRNSLCKEVLNDTWVSFPSWSEDSTFVSSRKTQYEEYIYRCEDERFELDVVLETNLSTIQIMEAVLNKMNRMSSEEKARFRLDDTLGGSSSVIHQRAIKRLYGDKAPDVIEGLKKNPATAVPLVLRRLKSKEEEWRKAQKSFNKIWKEQNEKYYLKSLDHQGITFKQNDVKFLRSKSILNEIETIYEERHEQNEDGVADVPVGPHIVVVYKNKDIFKDAANLIIHHVKRQTGIHKEDKQKIKQLMRQFLPDLFSVPRGELSDDEMDKDDDMEMDDDNDSSKTSAYQDLLALKMGSGATNHVFTHSDMSKDVPSTGDKGGPERLSLLEDQNAMENSFPGDSYALMFVNNNWYFFYRLHHILCERLWKIHERSQILMTEELKDQEERKKSTALALRLKPKNNICVESYYTTFLDMVKNLLDGNIESNQYEDTLREMFGIHAYLGFTLDKVVQNVVRQLQHVVGDEACTQCTSLFLEEQKNKAAGGPCASASQRATSETAYQRRAEQALNDENCFKLIIYKNEGKLTIELLDTDSDPSEDQVEDKWSNYVEKYASGDDSLPNELKEQLAKRPVFLPRNVRTRRHHDKAADNELSLNCMRDLDIDLSRLEDNCAGEAVKGLVGLNAKAMMMERSRHKGAEDVDIRDRSECKFNVNSYKMLFVVHSESYLYKQMALRKAHQSHRKVSEKLNKRFHRWHRAWLKDNVSEEQGIKCQNWLLGLTEDNKATLCIKVDNPAKAPYATFNRYRVQVLEKT